MNNSYNTHTILWTLIYYRSKHFFIQHLSCFEITSSTASHGLGPNYRFFSPACSAYKCTQLGKAWWGAQTKTATWEHTGEKLRYSLDVGVKDMACWCDTKASSQCTARWLFGWLYRVSQKLLWLQLQTNLHWYKVFIMSKQPLLFLLQEATELE